MRVMGVYMYLTVNFSMLQVDTDTALTCLT